MKLLIFAVIAMFALVSAAMAENTPLKWGQTDAVIPYANPKNLPVQEELPDLMTFLDGTPVETPED